MSKVLKAFLSTDITRKFITKPVVYEGKKYFTDGRVAVRVPTDEPNTDGDIPGVSGIFDKGRENTTKDLAWSVWPEASDLKRSIVDQEDKCGACGGLGTEVVECETCGGWGQVECTLCSHETACDDCNGVGSIPVGGTCSTCLGKGKRVGDLLVYEAAGLAVYIRSCDFSRIAALPGVCYLHPRKNPGIVVFTFEGGEGVFFGRAK